MGSNAVNAQDQWEEAILWEISSARFGGRKEDLAKNVEFARSLVDTREVSERTSRTRE